MRTLLIVASLCLASATLVAQQPQPRPKVQLNVLNVCAPSLEDREVISRALTAIPLNPAFTEDFEVARGRTTIDASDLDFVSETGKRADSGPSLWVRIRREFPEKHAFLNAQYSFSFSDRLVNETLVLRERDPKDVMQVSISDEVTAAARPGQVAAAGTPASRIRVERFGRSSVVLARCADRDQSALEPLFASASRLLASYRHALNAPSLVPAELARMEKAAGAGSRTKRHSSKP